MKGFYVGRSGKTGKETTAAAGRQDVRHPAHITVAAEPPMSPPDGDVLLASAGAQQAAPRLNTRKPLLAPPDSCDVIVMRNGTEIRARVLEISQSEVKYNKCTMPDGPAFVSLKSDILMITYVGGRKEVFERPVEPAIQHTPIMQRTEHPDAVTVYVLTVTGWLLGFGSIPAIIIGNRVLREIRAQPNRYRGEQGVKIAVIISWIRVALILAIILIIIATLAAI